MTLIPLDNEARLAQVRAEWLAITRQPAPDEGRFTELRREADAIVASGHWTSGPSDLLSILGRQRDELMHSRLIGWLLVPTNQHGLGRQFLHAFVDHLWPDDELLRSGPVFVETETSRWAADELGDIHAARADVLLRGDGTTLVIENKLDAGEQPDQCERLYWAWADQPVQTRWVFLTPTGRGPVTANSLAARSAWRTMSYADLRDVLAEAVEASGPTSSLGRSSVMQYLATLAGTARR
jgi:PD-(D/E)XK nuclease superfamily